MINYRIRSIRMLFVILMTLAAGAQMAHAAKGGRSDFYQKYVSQVINETFECNFNTLLGRYRIREACRRFNDPQRYGSYTIESIARDLGFKSRSNFATTFKKHTGLNPSEYLRLAKEKNGL